MTTPIIVLAGPSGVGKSTVVRWVRDHDPHVWFSVSATTRAPRPGEVDGENYHFITRERFEQMIADNAFLEWAEYAGNLYGTPLQPLLDHQAQGRPVLLEIELQGVRQVREHLPQAQLVFLAPPSWDDLVARLNGRGTEDPAVVERRLNTAREEMAAQGEFHTVVVNSTVESAGQALIDLLETRTK